MHTLVKKHLTTCMYILSFMISYFKVNFDALKIYVFSQVTLIKATNVAVEIQ